MAAVDYWIWISELRGLRGETRTALLRHFQGPEAIWYAEEGEILLVEGMDREQASRLRDRSLDAAQRIQGDCERLGIWILTMQDAAYPGRLRDTWDPPCVLYGRGRLPSVDDEAVIAVVGTRDCTPYGIACAEKLSYGLVSGGAVVATGLARGIDSAAARGALLAGGPVLGLLGNGLDVVYPKENQDLYEDVAAAGALISEHPPGTRPLSGNFPRRNRIMSGISVGTLVVEAPLRSGALITASLALEQGRDVFAVPGPIDAYASQGCDRLIRDGAGLVMDARDILECFEARFPEKLGTPRDLPPAPEGPDGPRRDALPSDRAEEAGEDPGGAPPTIPLYDSGLTDDQIAVMKILSLDPPMAADDVIELSGIPTRRVLSALTVLEIDGYVRQHSGRRYARTVGIREE